MEISGLILAGGAGRRLQGRDKGLQAWRGEPLVAHIKRRIEPQVAQLLISCNRNREQYARYAALARSDLRPDYQGPLAGIEAASADLAHSLLLVVPCDSPALPLDLGQRLLAALQQDPTLDLAFARCPQRDHYLHVLLRRHCLDSLPAYLDAGGRAVRHWYATLNTTAVDFPLAEAFHNHNHLEDFHPDSRR